KRIFNKNGFPLRIQTDCGSAFLSHEFQQQMENWFIKHSTSTPYHPQSQGLVERDKATINERIRLYVKPGQAIKWDNNLAELIFAI
ncbi:hypothetical protein Q0O77_14955, partial [Staphylococcus aureus]|nr:hypothetical protein [Staphylococcus aureus]